MRSYGLLLILLFGAQVGCWSQLRKTAHCRNHSGQVVDWWFILKESGKSNRYIYYDSRMAEIDDKTGRPSSFLPLNDNYLLDDEKTSPILWTLYASHPDLGNETDNTFTIAVNDQKPSSTASILNEIDEDLKDINKKTNDPNAYLTAADKYRDLFGNSLKDAGHSKYIFTFQVDHKAVPNSSAKMRGYLISHSLPRFPNFEEVKPGGTLRLPLVQRNVFGSNVSTPLSKGQHFFCKSLESDETLDTDGELEFTAQKVDQYISDQRYIVSLFVLFKVINAAVVYSNYFNQMHLPQFKIYTKLFDPRPKWSSEAAQKLPAKCMLPNRLYPFCTDCKAQRSTVCFKWPVADGDDKHCIRSFTIQTTSLQYGLEFHTIAHSVNVHVDIFDDLVAAQLIPKDYYYSKHRLNEGDKPKFWLDALMVQSWMEHTTLANNSKELIPKDDQNQPIQAKAWIVNVLSWRYPVHPDSTKQSGMQHVYEQINGNVHSKVFFSVSLNGVGKRIPLFGFSDKNRTIAQRGGRHPKDKGRSGAIWTTRSSTLAGLMLTLYPSIEDNARFASIKQEDILKHIPNTKTEDEYAVLGYSSTKKYIKIGHPSRSKPGAYRVAALFHPFVNNFQRDESFCPYTGEFPSLLYRYKAPSPIPLQISKLDEPGVVEEIVDDDSLDSLEGALMDYLVTEDTEGEIHNLEETLGFDAGTRETHKPFDDTYWTPISIRRDRRKPYVFTEEYVPPFKRIKLENKPEIVQSTLEIPSVDPSHPAQVTPKSYHQMIHQNPFSESKPSPWSFVGQNVLNFILNQSFPQSLVQLLNAIPTPKIIDQLYETLQS